MYVLAVAIRAGSAIVFGVLFGILRIARFRLDVSGAGGADVADGDDGWRVQCERRFHRLPEARSASISDIGGIFLCRSRRVGRGVVRFLVWGNPVS